MANSRPGVTVSEAPLPRVIANPNSSQSLGAFLGTALRGPTSPSLVTSWTDFVSQFGDFSATATLPYALNQYFANTGGYAYVARVLASDAVAATKTFGTPTRLTFTAITKGVWGNAISVDIVGATATDYSTFTLTVRENLRGVDVIRESFRALSMKQTDPKYILNIVNSLTIGSQYITVTDTKNDGLPLTTGGTTTLTGGTDGVASITSADYGAVFDKFDDIDANFVFNAPGVLDVSALVSKIAAGRQDSIVIADTAENQLPNMNGATLPVGTYGAVYYPWIWVADPSPDSVRGGIKKVPPGASVVGRIISTDTSRGVFKAPAGVAASLAGAVAAEQRLTNTDLNNLADMNVNVIRPVPGSGIAIMGARTRAFGTSDQYISVRRTINYVKKRAADVSRFALFEPNTPSLWEQLRVANGVFLSELFSAGGLSGTTSAQAYYVKCDGENNTSATISNGEVHVEIGIAPAFPAEFVVIRIGQFTSDASQNIQEG